MFIKRNASDLHVYIFENEYKMIQSMIHILDCSSPAYALFSINICSNLYSVHVNPSEDASRMLVVAVGSKHLSSFSFICFVVKQHLILG